MPTTPPESLTRSDLEAFWMPFTPNRQFKSKPRILAKASGMHYWTPEGRQLLDGVAGLWCVNAGHGRKEITQAVASQLETMDYAPPFQMGHPPAFALANAVVKIAPPADRRADGGAGRAGRGRLRGGPAGLPGQVRV
jgi:beta-alanine--pyruvate transaminase